MEAAAYNWRFSAAQASRGRISDHRRRAPVGQHAVNAAIGKPCVQKPAMKGFDRIRNHTTVKLAKSVKVFFSQQRLNGHARFLSRTKLTWLTITRTMRKLISPVAGNFREQEVLPGLTSDGLPGSIHELGVQIAPISCKKTGSAKGWRPV